MTCFHQHTFSFQFESWNFSNDLLQRYTYNFPLRFPAMISRMIRFLVASQNLYKNKWDNPVCVCISLVTGGFERSRRISRHRNDVRHNFFRPWQRENRTHWKSLRRKYWCSEIWIFLFINISKRPKKICLRKTIDSWMKYLQSHWMENRKRKLWRKKVKINECATEPKSWCFAIECMCAVSMRFFSSFFMGLRDEVKLRKCLTWFMRMELAQL